MKRFRNANARLWGAVVLVAVVVTAGVAIASMDSADAKASAPSVDKADTVQFDVSALGLVDRADRAGGGGGGGGAAGGSGGGAAGGGGADIKVAAYN